MRSAASETGEINGDVTSLNEGSNGESTPTSDVNERAI